LLFLADHKAEETGKDIKDGKKRTSRFAPNECEGKGKEEEKQ
jgi:hypothetical protein